MRNLHALTRVDAHADFVARNTACAPSAEPAAERVARSVGAQLRGDDAVHPGERDVQPCQRKYDVSHAPCARDTAALEFRGGDAAYKHDASADEPGRWNKPPERAVVVVVAPRRRPAVDRRLFDAGDAPGPPPVRGTRQGPARADHGKVSRVPVTRRLLIPCSPPRQQTFPFSPPQVHPDSGPPPPQHTLAQSHESPVPMRTSMFEFVSPFDTLTGPPPPSEQQQQQPQQHDPPKQDVPFEHQMQPSYTRYPSPPAKPRTPDVYQQAPRYKAPSPIPGHVHPLPAGSGSEGGKQGSPVSVGRRDMSPARGGNGRTKRERGERNRKTNLSNGSG